MYVIKHNGKPLYSPAVMDMSCRVLAPKVSLDINANGSCTFVLPPGNRMAGEIRRRKSIITVEQDGQEIFRSRVMDDENDKYKQKNVYCEGVRGYLNDSQAAPYSYSGTPRGLLNKLISEHNEQVEEDKRLVIGDVTIDRADEALECENVAYWETFREIDEKLLSAYGGYLRTRMEGGVLYLDWVKEYGRANPQKIRFAVNLLDLRDKHDSADMFTILRPLGASSIGDDGEYGDPLTIASVNGGLDYIQDDAAVAQYGRIWKTQTWTHIEDPAELLAKGREFMKIGAELRTITLQAIDMHFLDGSIDAIRVGDKVHILSQPHGIDIEKVCCRIEIDIANPENTTYTFGEPPRALTDNIVTAEEEIDSMTGYKGGGGGRAGVKEEMTGILRWAQVKVDQANANIQLLTGEANSLDNRLSKAEIEIDGINAQILLKASQEEVDDLGMRMSQAEIEIDGANAEILLKASKTEVDAMGKRVSAAEIRIDGAESEIELRASKVYVDAEITKVKTLVADKIEALYSDVNYDISESVSTKAMTVSGDGWVSGKLTATSISAGSLKVDGNGMSLKSQTVLTSSTSLTVNSTGGTVTGVTLNKKTETLYYMSWE